MGIDWRCLEQFGRSNMHVEDYISAKNVGN
jgi:hypothetical protein